MVRGAMERSLSQQLRRLRQAMVNRAWRAQWRAVRAIATSWAKKDLAVAQERLRSAPRRDVVIDRDALERWVSAAAPPEVPFEAVVLPGSTLAARFPDGPDARRGKHLIGRMRLTHRGIPSESVLVFALFSDVAADYFIESMAADIANEINSTYGAGTALADAQAGVPVVLKELATAAGLGVIGKNALFYSHRFGFNCKLAAVMMSAPVSRYSPTPTNTDWKLPDCSTCNLCVEACPVSAFDNYEIHGVEACDRLLASDYFGPRRDHMCRACITRCPVSNDLLKIRRREGAPQRTFWDNEAQLALAADLFMYRPSFWVWLLQRFYYGASLPGRPARDKKGIGETFSSAVTVATSERTRDGWRLAALKQQRR